MVLMRIANYECDPGQSRNFLRRSLRVATRDHDLALGILALNSADGSTGILIGGGGYRTGIQNDYLGFLQSSCYFQSTLKKLALYGSAIRLRRPTAKILYVKTRHSHILA